NYFSKAPVNVNAPDSASSNVFRCERRFFVLAFSRLELDYEVGSMKQFLWVNAASVVGRCMYAASAAFIFALTTASPAGAQAPGYWHTSGNQILDSSNHPVRIAGINWYGFETTDEVAHGLWAQDYKAVLNTIKDNGYNVIRVPFSNQMIEQPIIPSNINY